MTRPRTAPATGSPATGSPATGSSSAGSLAGRHVAVVGGGLAGIAAALQAADQGARVTLVERRRRLGGLTWSFQHDGMWMDNGQHVYLSCCADYLAFLRRIGSDGDVEPARPLDVAVISPGPAPGAAPVVGRLRRRPGRPVPLHLAGSLMRYPHIGWGDRSRLGRALAALWRLDLEDPALDRVTFGEWLATHGQSPRTVEAVWDLITVPTVNLPAAEASLAVAAMVMKTALLSHPGAADIGWSRVPLGRLHGERGATALDRAGVRVLGNTRVRAVTARREGTWSVVTEGDGFDCDAVIVALPHEEAASVVPAGAAPSQRRWAELGSSAIVDVHLVFERPVTDLAFLAGHRSPVQWVFDRTVACGREPGPDAPQYLAVSLSAADHLLGTRPEQIISSTLTDLARLLPRAGSTRLVGSTVTKERGATFRAAAGTAALRPGPSTARPGLALAGAWTATGWPATMEGAVRSGGAAVRALQEAFGPAGPGRPIHIPQEVA